MKGVLEVFIEEDIKDRMLQSNSFTLQARCKDISLTCTVEFTLEVCNIKSVFNKNDNPSKLIIAKKSKWPIKLRWKTFLKFRFISKPFPIPLLKRFKFNSQVTQFFHANPSSKVVVLCWWLMQQVFRWKSPTLISITIHTYSAYFCVFKVCTSQIWTSFGVHNF